MDYHFISFEVEQQIKKEIKDLFEFEVIQEIVKKGKVEGDKNRIKLIQEGMSFKISEQLSPKTLLLTNEVLKSLEFEEPVEFFIMNSPETNAFAVPKGDDDDCHLVIITSEIIKQFDDEELKFIIGHEIGHLISGYAKISNIIDFVFPATDSMPSIIINKLNFWKKLAELTADRYGYIASPNIEKVISTFFKLSSGLDTKKISFNHQAYIEEVSEVIEKYKENPTMMVGSHPINPIRIKAIKYFSESELYKLINSKKGLRKDEILQNRVLDIAKLMTVLSISQLDVFRSYFLATGGIIAAFADENLSESEHAHIINSLGTFEMFPNKFLKDLLETKKVNEIFDESVSYILEHNPSEKYPMIEYLIDIVLMDRQILNEEVNLIFDIGTKKFRMNEKEIAQIIAAKIRKGFVPKFYY